LWIAAEMGGVVQIADPATRQITAKIAFAPPGVQPICVMPCGIRFTPDGKKAVVALGRANHIAIVDVATRRVESYVKVGQRPWHLAITPDGARAIVANGLSDDVSIVDLSTKAVVATIRRAPGHGAWPLRPESMLV
jgi:YVTN family beta-propeller protein